MKIKPLVISGLTQEQRNRYVRSAGYSGQKLNEWVRDVLDAAASQVLHFEDRVVDDWVSPPWLAELSTRTAMCLINAGYENKDDVRADWASKPKAFFYSIPNFGNKTYSEIEQWIKQPTQN